MESTLLISFEKTFNRVSALSFFLRKNKKQIVQQSVDCDVILDPKQMKVFEMC